MEVKIYEVCLDIDCLEPEDYLKIGEWRTIYANTFATKQSAIRVCQSKFAKQYINDYVKAVHAEVTEVTITERGRTAAKRIYNKFKKR